MVQRLAPPLGGGDGYVQVALDLALPDEVAQVAGPEVAVQRDVVAVRFA